MENAQVDLKLVALSQAQTPRYWLGAHARLIMGAGLFISDLLSLLTAGFVAAYLRRLVLGIDLPAFFAWMLPLSFLFSIVCMTRGLYPGIGLGAVEELRSLTITTSLFFVIAGTFTYLTQVEASFSRMVFGLMFAFSLVLLPFNRILVRHWMTKTGWWGEPVAIIGAWPAVERLARHFREHPKIGLRPVMLFAPADGHAEQDPALPVYSLPLVAELSAEQHLGTAVVLYENLNELSIIRKQYRDLFARVIMMNAHSDGIDLSGLRVSNFGDLLSFELRYSLLDPLTQGIKRLIDLVGAGLGLLIFSPLLGLLALLISLDSQGGVFYRQPRVGKDGRKFGMLKFRSMHVNADQLLREYLAKDPSMKAEWDCYQKLREDPRITRVGMLLRRFSLDELPQLWNVLVGEMSLVGPRPIMMDQVALYGPKLEHYSRVVPGITGLWQVSGRNRTSFAQRTEFDMYYVMNWSIWLDVYILIRTVWVVLRRDGAC